VPYLHAALVAGGSVASSPALQAQGQMFPPAFPEGEHQTAHGSSGRATFNPKLLPTSQAGWPRPRSHTAAPRLPAGSRSAGPALASSISCWSNCRRARHQPVCRGHAPILQAKTSPSAPHAYLCRQGARTGSYAVQPAVAFSMQAACSVSTPQSTRCCS